MFVKKKEMYVFVFIIGIEKHTINWKTALKKIYA